MKSRFPVCDSETYSGPSSLVSHYCFPGAATDSRMTYVHCSTTSWRKLRIPILENIPQTTLGSYPVYTLDLPCRMKGITPIAVLIYVKKWWRLSNPIITRFCRNSSYIAKTTNFLSSDGSVRLTQPEAESRILNYRTIVKLDIAGLYSISELLL